MAVVATAEQTFQSVAPEIANPDVPLVIVVPEMVEDELPRQRAERLIRLVGSTAVRSSLETEPSINRIPNLMEAIHLAAVGDQEALAYLWASASTDGIERTIKSGHISEIFLSVGKDGQTWQNGQTGSQVQENTLRFASGTWQMRQRAEAEARNSFRLENINQLGLLMDYYFVVVSRTADNMTSEALTQAGFFVDTMPCAIQATTARGHQLVTESAFVAGVKTPGDELHDARTVIEMGTALGVDYTGKTAAQIIDYPLLIHKSLMPGGVINLVKLYDQVAGGTFFGEAKPPQGYLRYRELCRQRETTYAPKIQQIVHELIAQAAFIRTPIEAVRQLHEISERHMLEKAVGDRSINALVFGPEAAGYLEQARLHHERGDKELATVATKRAQATAHSYSCPANWFAEEVVNEDGAVRDQSTTKNKAERKKMSCPFCGDKNQYGDPCSPNQHCKACNARVTGGKVVSKGNGGAKTKKIDVPKPAEIEKPSEVPDLEEYRNKKRAQTAVRVAYTKVPA